jgi:polyferredoxin
MPMSTASLVFLSSCTFWTPQRGGTLNIFMRRKEIKKIKSEEARIVFFYLLFLSILPFKGWSLECHRLTLE